MHIRCSLGLPLDYMDFSTDDPEYFISKIKYLLENDIDDAGLVISQNSLSQLLPRY